MCALVYRRGNYVVHKAKDRPGFVVSVDSRRKTIIGYGKTLTECSDIMDKTEYFLDEVDEERVCKKCGKRLPLNNEYFGYRDARHLDFKITCKQCCNEATVRSKNKNEN